jgi:hypothetical protein
MVGENTSRFLPPAAASPIRTASAGRIAYVKVGRYVRITVRDLDAFIAAGRVDVAELPILQRGA